MSKKIIKYEKTMCFVYVFIISKFYNAMSETFSLQTQDVGPLFV